MYHEQIKVLMLTTRAMAVKVLTHLVADKLRDNDSETLNLSDLHIANPIVAEHVEEELNDVVSCLFIADGVLCFEIDNSMGTRDLGVNDAEIDMGILVYLIEEFENLN